MPSTLEKFCPMDVLGIGDCIWKILHKIVANYPENASKPQEREMYIFIHMFAQFYPCKQCSDQFFLAMKRLPPPLDTRSHFKCWLCAVNSLMNSDTILEDLDSSEDEPSGRRNQNNNCVDESQKKIVRNRSVKRAGSRTTKKNSVVSKTSTSKQVPESTKKTK